MQTPIALTFCLHAKQIRGGVARQAASERYRAIGGYSSYSIAISLYTAPLSGWARDSISQTSCALKVSSRSTTHTLQVYGGHSLGRFGPPSAMVAMLVHTLATKFHIYDLNLFPKRVELLGINWFQTPLSLVMLCY